jgi:putative serine protease PepD
MSWDHDTRPDPSPKDEAGSPSPSVDETPTIEQDRPVAEAPTAEQAWQPPATPQAPPAQPAWPASPPPLATPPAPPAPAAAPPTAPTVPTLPSAPPVAGQPAPPSPWAGYPAAGSHAAPPAQPPVPPYYGGAPTPPPPLPPASSTAPPRKGGGLRLVAAALVGALLVLAGFGARILVEDDKEPTAFRGTTVSTVTQSSVDPDEEPLAAVAAAVSDSIVQIELSDGLGSGVVFDNEGHVLTNAHVVGSNTSVTVRDADGNAYDGRVIGVDTGTDIAVVAVEGLDLPAAAIATTVPVVGQTAVAVGSPFGLEQTVTAGIVSAVNRPVDNDRNVVVNMIQTDAAINPGNSGGALLNKEGELIGINTAIFSQSGGNDGIGFAIPIAVAAKTANNIIDGQSTAKAGLGLSGPSETPSGDAGAYVQSIVPGGAAERSGLQVGDLIVSVDGFAVRSFEQLRGIISSYSPGDTVTVEVERDGQPVSIEVTLGTLSSSTTN